MAVAENRRPSVIGFPQHRCPNKKNEAVLGDGKSRDEC
jgi:hypothetical protein